MYFYFEIQRAACYGTDVSEHFVPSPEASPPIHRPPSGRKVALVLIAILLILLLTCAACVLSYAYYVDIKSR